MSPFVVRRVVIVFAGAVLAAWAHAQAQFQEELTPLTLEQAVDLALEHNPAFQAEIEKAHAEEARSKLARAALLPSLDVYEGLTRSDDPVFVFGTLLRQGQFTAANFDLDALNFPPPLSDLQTRVDARGPLFDLAGYRRVGAAKRSRSAADFRTDQERQDLLLRVIATYDAVAVAKENLKAAREALKTAESNEKRVGDMAAAGNVVKSDLLDAQVFRAQMQSREIVAENELELARMELGHELGLEVQAVPDTAGGLRGPIALTMTLEEYEQAALSTRPGLSAATMEHVAASEGRKAASSEFSPRLDGFASWQRDAEPGGPADTSWSAGVLIGLNLFAGGASRYRLAEASARERQAEAESRWMLSAVRLEVRKSFLDVRSAEKRADVAQAGVDQAQESLRIVEDRYQTGLATMTDLLRAQTASLEARTASMTALHDWHVARVRLERAAGRLTRDSEVVLGGRP